MAPQMPAALDNSMPAAAFVGRRHVLASCRQRLFMPWNDTHTGFRPHSGCNATAFLPGSQMELQAQALEWLLDLEFSIAWQMP